MERQRFIGDTWLFFALKVGLKVIPKELRFRVCFKRGYFFILLSIPYLFKFGFIADKPVPLWSPREWSIYMKGRRFLNFLKFIFLIPLFLKERCCYFCYSANGATSNAPHYGRYICDPCRSYLYHKKADKKEIRNFFFERHSYIYGASNWMRYVDYLRHLVGRLRIQIYLRYGLEAERRRAEREHDTTS